MTDEVTCNRNPIHGNTTCVGLCWSSFIPMDAMSKRLNDWMKKGILIHKSSVVLLSLSLYAFIIDFFHELFFCRCL